MGSLESKFKEDYQDYKKICSLLGVPPKSSNGFLDDFDELKKDSKIVYRNCQYQLKGNE